MAEAFEKKMKERKKSVIFLFSGQQQHFRPFFDSRFTGHLLELRRKSDPFSMTTSTQGKC